MTKDTIVSQFTEETSVLYNDRVPFISDPSGSPKARIAPINNFLSGKEITVVASDAPARWKKHADYICTGANDSAQLALALAALGASLGGTILLSEGKFYFTSQIEHHGWQPIAIKGLSSKSTFLNFDFTTPMACISIATATATQACLFSGFSIVGDDTNTSIGILCKTGVAYAHFYDIRISGTDTGFETEDFCTQIYAEYVRVRDPINYGFYLGNCGASLFSQCYAQGGGTATGFYVSGNCNTLVGCVTDLLDIGFVVDDVAVGTTLINPYSEGNNTGFSFAPTKNHSLLPYSTTVIGGFCTVYAGATGTASVMIGRDHYLTIIGLTISTQIDLPSFDIAANCTQVRLINCHAGDSYSGALPTNPYVIAAGADVWIDDPYYHPTHNHGATSVADGGTIDHGLLLAPTNVTLTASIAGEIVTITTLDATHITVGIKKNDGTAGTTQTIYWRAEV